MSNPAEHDHIGVEDIRRLLQNKLLRRHPPELRRHLRTCRPCQELVTLLRSAAQRASTAAQPADRHWSESQINEAITDIYERTISATRAAELVGHLHACEACFSSFARILREAPVTAEEPAVAENFAHLSLADKALAIIDRQPPHRPKASPLAQIRDRIKDWLGEVTWTPKYGLATAAAIALMVVGGYFGVRFYQTTYPLHRAAELLQEHHAIYIQNARITGDYPSTPVLQLLSGEEEEEDYLSRVIRLTGQALKHDPDSPRAKHLRAQVFIIQGKWSAADSLLRQVIDAPDVSASAFNDLGVLRYQQGRWREAARHFSQAIEKDPQLAEAYYNLALAQMKLESPTEAIATLERYLQLEKDEGWRLAAMNLLRKLRERSE